MNEHRYTEQIKTQWDEVVEQMFSHLLWKASGDSDGRSEPSKELLEAVMSIPGVKATVTEEIFNGLHEMIRARPDVFMEMDQFEDKERAAIMALIEAGNSTT